MPFLLTFETWSSSSSLTFWSSWFGKVDSDCFVFDVCSVAFEAFVSFFKSIVSHEGELSFIIFLDEDVDNVSVRLKGISQVFLSDVGCKRCDEKFGLLIWLILSLFGR